jgi:hypothetical protein
MQSASPSPDGFAGDYVFASAEAMREALRRVREARVQRLFAHGKLESGPTAICLLMPNEHQQALAGHHGEATSANGFELS